MRDHDHRFTANQMKSPSHQVHYIERRFLITECRLLICPFRASRLYGDSGKSRDPHKRWFSDAAGQRRPYKTVVKVVHVLDFSFDVPEPPAPSPRPRASWLVHAGGQFSGLALVQGCVHVTGQGVANSLDRNSIWSRECVYGQSPVHRQTSRQRRPKPESGRESLTGWRFLQTIRSVTRSSRLKINEINQ